MSSQVVKLISKGAEVDPQIVDLNSVLSSCQTSIDKESLEQIVNSQSSNSNSDSATSSTGFLQVIQGPKERTLSQCTIPCKSYKYPDKNIKSSCLKQPTSRFCKYVISKSKSVNECQPTREDLIQMTADLAKKMKNLNCIENYTQKVDPLSTKTIDMNKDGMNDISVFDYERQLLKVAVTPERVVMNYIHLVPSVQLQFFALDKSIKLVSTPISRLLIGKTSEKDRATIKITNFDPSGLYSGFLSLDQEKRIYPLLSNFQDDRDSQALPVVGLWFHGLSFESSSIFNSDFVYGHCLRFILSRNVQKLAQNFKKNEFVVLVFNQNKTPEFFRLRVMLEQSQQQMAQYESSMIEPSFVPNWSISQ